MTAHPLPLPEKQILPAPSTPAGSPLRELAASMDPVLQLVHAGLVADPWQEKVLRSDAPRIILNCSRQAGKSTIVAAKASHVVEHVENRTIILGAPSQNQSAELLDKVKGVLSMTGHVTTRVVEGESVLRMRLQNKSRLICVPGLPRTVRGYSSPRLIVIDEAAYVLDEFYRAVFPMLAASPDGEIILLSTPHAREGAFWNIWDGTPDWDPNLPARAQPAAWQKIRVTWRDCPRITPEFIAKERVLWGDLYVQREYECEFVDIDTSVFTPEEIARMKDDTVETWDLW